MENLKQQQQDNPYNNEKVFCCTHCLSLRIRGVPNSDDYNYCDSCGTTDIASCSIQEWEELYKQKYGHKYLENYL